MGKSRWADHVQRMNSNEMTKRIMEKTLMGKMEEGSAEGSYLDGCMVHWSMLTD